MFQQFCFTEPFLSHPYEIQLLYNKLITCETMLLFSSDKQKKRTTYFWNIAQTFISIRSKEMLLNTLYKLPLKMGMSKSSNFYLKMVSMFTVKMILHYK